MSQGDWVELAMLLQFFERVRPVVSSTVLRLRIVDPGSIMTSQPGRRWRQRSPRRPNSARRDYRALSA